MSEPEQEGGSESHSTKENFRALNVLSGDAPPVYPSGVGAVSGLFGLPIPRHEFADAMDLVVWQALEDQCEPLFGADVVQLAGFHERVGDGGRFSAAD